MTLVRNLLLAALLASGMVGISASAAPINATSYGSLTSTGLIDFEDLVAAPFPGTAIEGVLDLDGASFAERFDGQTTGVAGNFDTLTGSPTNPLTLVAGATGQNLVAANAGGIGIAGLGPLGFPDLDANGEGALSILFDDDTSEFGLEIRGVDAGTGDLNLDFYRRDGTLIESVSFALVADGFFGFVRELGIIDIAGVAITNDDVGGVGVDNIVFQPVPEPSTALSVVLGLAILARRQPRKLRS